MRPSLSISIITLALVAALFHGVHSFESSELVKRLQQSGHLANPIPGGELEQVLKKKKIGIKEAKPTPIKEANQKNTIPKFKNNPPPALAISKANSPDQHQLQNPNHQPKSSPSSKKLATNSPRANSVPSEKSPKLVNVKKNGASHEHLKDHGTSPKHQPKSLPSSKKLGANSPRALSEPSAKSPKLVNVKKNGASHEHLKDHGTSPKHQLKSSPSSKKLAANSPRAKSVPSEKSPQLANMVKRNGASQENHGTAKGLAALKHSKSMKELKKDGPISPSLVKQKSLNGRKSEGPPMAQHHAEEHLEGTNKHGEDGSKSQKSHSTPISHHQPNNAEPQSPKNHKAATRGEKKKKKGKKNGVNKENVEPNVAPPHDDGKVANAAKVSNTLGVHHQQPAEAPEFKEEENKEEIPVEMMKNENAAEQAGIFAEDKAMEEPLFNEKKGLGDLVEESPLKNEFETARNEEKSELDNTDPIIVDELNDGEMNSMNVDVEHNFVENGNANSNIHETEHAYEDLPKDNEFEQVSTDQNDEVLASKNGLLDTDEAINNLEGISNEGENEEISPLGSEQKSNSIDNKQMERNAWASEKYNKDVKGIDRSYTAPVKNRVKSEWQDAGKYTGETKETVKSYTEPEEIGQVKSEWQDAGKYTGERKETVKSYTEPVEIGQVKSEWQDAGKYTGERKETVKSYQEPSRNRLESVWGNDEKGNSVFNGERVKTVKTYDVPEKINPVQSAWNENGQFVREVEKNGLEQYQDARKAKVYKTNMQDLKCNDLKTTNVEKVKCRKWQAVVDLINAEVQTTFYSMRKMGESSRCETMGKVKLNKEKLEAYEKIEELRGAHGSGIPTPPALSKTANCEWNEFEMRKYKI